MFVCFFFFYSVQGWSGSANSHHNHEPKLEDFLGDSSPMMRYSDSQTETQDSSLTHIYDHAYFGDQQDFKTIAAFQAFSGNSGSEVDDSVSITRTQIAAAEIPTGALSLAVVQSSDTASAVVAVDSDSSKKIADTFGQRTSIYRGVTRLVHSNIFSIACFWVLMAILLNGCWIFADIDGRGDMKRIYGTIAVEERVKLGKDDKVGLCSFKKMSFLLMGFA